MKQNKQTLTRRVLFLLNKFQFSAQNLQHFQQTKKSFQTKGFEKNDRFILQMQLISRSSSAKSFFYYSGNKDNSRFVKNQSDSTFRTPGKQNLKSLEKLNIIGQLNFDDTTNIKRRLFESSNKRNHDSSNDKTNYVYHLTHQSDNKRSLFEHTDDEDIRDHRTPFSKPCFTKTRRLKTIREINKIDSRNKQGSVNSEKSSRSLKIKVTQSRFNRSKESKIGVKQTQEKSKVLYQYSSKLQNSEHMSVKSMMRAKGHKINDIERKLPKNNFALETAIEEKQLTEGDFSESTVRQEKAEIPFWSPEPKSNSSIQKVNFTGHTAITNTFPRMPASSVQYCGFQNTYHTFNRY